MAVSNAGRRLLIVDADVKFREVLATEFKRRGYETATADSYHSYRAMAEHEFNYATVDLKLDCGSGLTILEEIKDQEPACRVVIVTSYGSIATAVKAIKLGAHDYLTKPTSIAAIENALLGAGKHDETGAIREDAVPSLARHEREYIEHVLEQCDGNISEAARRLGLHRQSLQRKLRKYPPSR